MKKRMRKRVVRKAGRPPGGVNGQRVRDYPQVSIRVPPKLYAQLARLSRSTGLSRLEIFMRAIDCYEDYLRSQRRRQRRRDAA
ncbi:MAG TPA: ribbon-helix-helix domain-containing protein [Vicinamibacterales bacterium]|nr:ribbon-helix-helix domain-containing protein [Vicinamibacterales bacterium]